MEQYIQINQMFWNGSPFQYIFYISVLLILILEKRKLHKIVFGVFPIVVIVGIFNPVTSWAVRFLFRTSNLYYVRLFSIVPVFYCMAHGAMLLLDRVRGAVKLCGVCAVAGIIVFTGHSVYQEPWMQRAENMEKVPDEVLAVLDVIPREKENPRVAFPDPLYLYARQVDGDIIMPYGRQLGGGPIQFLEELNKPVPDAPTVMTMAGEKSVDYIVVNRSEDARTAFSNSGYEPIGETSGYYVYPVMGINRVVLTLNEKRQVESSTICDPSGNPTNNGSVIITTTAYEYDRWGNRTKETYYDKDGQRVTTIDGYSGRRRSYRLHGLSWAVDSIKYFDTMDQPLLASGRYETRYKYVKRRDVIEESYYDIDGRPMNRLDKGYAATLKCYDLLGRIVSERFTDTSGKAVVSSDGYAGYTREYDDHNRVISEKYYNTEGVIGNNAFGFAEWTKAYDDSGNVVAEAFSDEDGNMVDIKGRVMQDTAFDLLQRARKENVANSVGIGYKWNEDGSCTVTGTARGISWNSMLEGDRPFYLINGETYRVQYDSENVDLRIYFYEDSTWINRIDMLATHGDTEFTVPQNCGAVIARLWVAPGTSINETVHPRIYAKAS